MSSQLELHPRLRQHQDAPTNDRLRANRHRLVPLVLGACLLTLTGCPNGERTGPEDPSNASSARRDTEMKHEDCDLTAGGSMSTDANHDGSPDIVRVMSGGREICRAVDINMDKVIDVYVYFDDGGKMRRRESGFDRDTRPDEISYYEGGQLVRKERETNFDGKLDTWDYYKNGRLANEERDSTGDCFIDQWWSFNRPDRPSCAVVVSDGDGDGKPEPESQIDLCADGRAPVPKSTEPAEEEKDESDSDSPAEDAEPKESEPSDEGESTGSDDDEESP
ncbi:MAG: hypothetical protein JRI68_23320 [Deltaproteobacteria bacterium]|nr:hypothetical protein [Deltaproteobacteria bacterium]